MGEELGEDEARVPTEPVETPTAPKPVLTRDEKRRRFLIGFLGWWLVNVPLAMVLNARHLAEVLFMVFFVQVVLLIIMAFANRAVALGMLAAIGLNLVISILFGLLFNALCWIPVSTPLPFY